jgi:hypothetical protein
MYLHTVWTCSGLPPSIVYRRCPPRARQNIRTKYKREGVMETGNGGGWRGLVGHTRQCSKRCSIVLGSSSFPDPDWPDLSNEISPGRCSPPPPHAGGVELARPLRLYQLATAHANTSKMGHTLSRISHWTLDMHLTSPFPPLRSSLPSFPCYISSALGIFAIPAPASCSSSPQ